MKEPWVAVSVGILVAIISISMMMLIFTHDLARKDDVDDLHKRANAAMAALLKIDSTLKAVTDRLGMPPFKLDFRLFLDLSVILIKNSYKDGLVTSTVPFPSKMESPEIVCRKTDALLDVARVYLSVSQKSFSKYVLNKVTDFYERNLVYQFTEEQKAIINELSVLIEDVEAEDPLNHLKD